MSTTVDCYATLNQNTYSSSVCSVSISGDNPNQNYYRYSDDWEYTVRDYTGESVLLKFDTSSLQSYKKKVINSVWVAMHLNAIGHTRIVGGTLSWLDTSFDASTVTHNTQPSSDVAFLLDYQNVFIDYLFQIQWYNLGEFKYGGTPAPRNLYDQLSVGFLLSNKAKIADKQNVNYYISGWNYTYPGNTLCFKLQFEFTDWYPTLIPRFPISGAFVKSSVNNAFSVSFDAFDSIDYPTAQTIIYEIKDVAAGTTSSHTASVSINLKDRTYVEWIVPAGTLTNNKDYQFRAKITTDDGETGFSDWADFTTKDATPGIPTIISPQAKYLVGSDSITLQWQHNITTGSTQYAYDLQYQQTGSWTDIVSHSVSNAQSYTLAPDFFAAGTMYWRVRTYNTDDVAGDWGTSSANVIQAKPITPILYGVTTSPRISMNWQSVEQQAYRVTVTDPNGNTAFDSYDTYGTEKFLMIDKYLADGNYTICLQIENGLGIWSDCAYQTIKVSNSAQPGDDFLTATPILGGVKINVSLPEPIGASYVGDDIYVGEVYAAHQPYNASGTRYILRDGEPIASITGTTYVDYTCSGLHEYVCRIVLDGNYHDTNAVQASPLIKYAFISEFESPDDIIVLKFNEGGAPTKENQMARTFSSNFYAGRSLPVHDTTEHYTSVWNFGYSMLKKSEYDKLLEMFLDNKTVIYRDRTGFKAVGTLANLKPTPKANGAIAVSFTIEENDSSEVIDYA